MNKFEKYGLLDYVFVREFRKKGYPHIHCYLVFTKKIDTCCVDFFDLYLNSKVFNAYIRSIHEDKFVLDYFSKCIFNSENASENFLALSAMS